jgi:hypothetical protein
LTDRLSILIAAVVAMAALPAMAQAQEAAAFADCKLYSLRRSSLVPASDQPNRMVATGSANQPVVITCDETVLSADRIEYERDTQLITAIGQVLFQQRDVRIIASRVEMNGKTKLGTFYEASGQAQLGAQPSQKSLFGNLEPDVYFSGKVLAKVGPKTYTLTDGTLTTCVQATPRWEMRTSKGTMVLDRHALLRNMVLKVKDVPLMYVPFMYYPINTDGRSTGFLMPSYSTDTIAGSGIDNAFFLVMGRSSDALFTHKWSSKSGHTLATEYRYVTAPGSQGTARFLMQNQRELFDSSGRSVFAAKRVFRVAGNANQELAGNFRLIGYADYYTDASTQQLYQQNIQDSSLRTRSINATLSGSINRYQLTAMFQQQDTFFGQTTALRNGTAPLARLIVSNKAIGRSKVYVGGRAEGAYLLRQQDVNDPTTNLSLGRFDGDSSVRMPIGSLPFLSMTTQASWRVTRWLESIDPVTQQQVPVALNRQLLTLTANVAGPTVSRVFDTRSAFAERLKHLVEPNFSITWTSPFEPFNRVAFSDSVDTLFGGTTRIDYGLSNVLIAKRRAPAGAAAGATGPTRTILTARISQSYYTDAAAAQFDTYQEESGAKKFSDVRFDVSSQATDSVSSSLQLVVDSKYRTITSISALATLNGKHVQVTPSWSRARFVDPLTRIAETTAHYLSTSTTVRTADSRLGGTYSFTLNVQSRDFLQQRIIASYNTQCCGIALDYQSRQTYLVNVPTTHTIGISFTLAGLGTFANPFGSFGGK